MGLPLFQLRVHGLSYGDDQTWSLGLKLRGADAAFDPSGFDKLDQWRDAVRALNDGNILPAAARSIMGNQVTITGIRCSSLGADGKETAVSTYDLTAPIYGTTTSQMPGQVACTVSLLTGRPGASYRGRLYLPASGATLNSEGRLTAVVTSALATQMGGWISDVGNAGANIFSPQLTPVVYSGHLSVANAITQCRVGDRLDIQRRRADKEKEAYSVAVVPQ